jgi:hypothetical protein
LKLWAKDCVEVFGLVVAASCAGVHFFETFGPRVMGVVLLELDYVLVYTIEYPSFYCWPSDISTPIDETSIVLLWWGLVTS